MVKYLCSRFLGCFYYSDQYNEWYDRSGRIISEDLNDVLRDTVEYLSEDASMQYEWRSLITDETVTVDRSIDDRDRLPTEDELQDAGNLDINRDNYIRVLTANKFTRGDNWKGKKGEF